MKEYAHNLIKKVNQQLDVLEKENDSVFKKVPKTISLLEKVFIELKGFILQYNFSDIEEEIYFFKEVKPQLFSKLIYNRKIYTIESMRPNGSIEAQKSYLKTQMDYLKGFFDKNLDFYKYYRTGCTHLDKYYFTRGNPDIELNVDLFYFERDPNFSTCSDFKVAKIIANEMLSIYLNSELIRLQSQEQNKDKYIETLYPKSKLTWTGKKAELVEQIYAWERAGSFNNSNVNIKELTEYVEFVFNIDLGDYYHTFLEMRDRKGSRTIFLDRLIKYLNDRMDEADNK